MEIKPLKLEGTFEIVPRVIGDSRGFFCETYIKSEFEKAGISADWKQENRSLSTRLHTLRGLHFQKPTAAQTKLVSVMEGRILDVFVDIRKNSPTYGEWDSVELDAESCNAVFIPAGFAHGFCTLTERSVVYYKVDHPYSPEDEEGISWNDKDLEIDWPTEKPFLSDRDGKLGSFADFESPF